MEAGSGAEPAVVLRPGGKLSVTVTTADGQPVPGAAMELIAADGSDVTAALLLQALAGGAARRETGSDGTLLLEQVPAGAYRIAATTEAVRSREGRIQVRPGLTTEVRLVLQRE